MVNSTSDIQKGVSMMASAAIGIPSDKQRMYKQLIEALQVLFDERSRVMDNSGRPFKNVFAADEIMSGNVLTKRYLNGMGLAIGAIVGELVGRDAATNGGS
jgi:hypothetical protein